MSKDEEGYIENKEVTRFKPVTTKRPGFEFPKKKHKGKCCKCVGDGK